jgi:hypothetical protein
MTNDVTSQLIQRIINQLQQSDPVAASAQSAQPDLLSYLNGIVGTAANYYQILSVIPAAQIALKQAAAAYAAGDNAAMAAAAAVGNSTIALAEGGVFLFISIFLAVVSSMNSNNPTQQELDLLSQLAQTTLGATLDTYWTFKMGQIAAYQTPLQKDLDFFASEGFKGPDVTPNVHNFVNDATNFMINLLPLPGMNTADGIAFWQRPYVLNLIFAAEQVNYPTHPEQGAPPDTPLEIGTIMGWYGTLPQPVQTSYMGSGVVADPKTVLPFLLWGVGSLLTIRALVSVIDPSQATFSYYVDHFGSDLEDYADFLQLQFETAINGIVKTDIPSFTDVMGYVYYQAIAYGLTPPPQPPFPWPDQPPSAPYPGVPYGFSWPFNGYWWNGVYGAADRYSVYPSPVPVPSAWPSNLIDITDPIASNMNALLMITDEFDQLDTELHLMYPWLKCKLTLAIMARWKAIYLINGYDQIWPVIQNLRRLAKLPPLPTERLEQDNLIADGNWSGRELLGILTANAGASDASLGSSPNSLFYVVWSLDSIALGNWAGGAGTSGYAAPHDGPARPKSFRDRLASAAL